MASCTPINLVLPVARQAGTAAQGQGSPDRREEFETILSQSLPRFTRMATRILRNIEDAEDAVQDAMLSAFRHIRQFDGRSQLSTWVNAIVLNAVRMQIRRRPRGRLLSLEQSLEGRQLTIAEILSDPRPSPDHVVEQRQLHSLLNDLAEKLPHAQQRVLRLRFGDELSPQETARKMKVPLGTVKARTARGRARLKERFRNATTKRSSRVPRLDSKRAGFRRDAVLGNAIPEIAFPKRKEESRGPIPA